MPIRIISSAYYGKMADLTLQDFRLDMQERLDDYFHCYNCKFFPYNDEIYKCDQDLHLICSECQDQGCPCNTKAQLLRCEFSEELRAIMTVKCSHPNDRWHRTKGVECTRFGPPIEMLEHEKSCEFRLVNCPDNRKHRVPYKEFVQHLHDSHKYLDYHKSACLKREMLFTRELYQRSGAPLKYWDPIWISVYKREFFLNCHMNAFNGTAIKIWIYFLGSPKEAEDFQFTARLTGKDGEEVKYTGKVKSLETPIGDIERGFECLVVGQQTANELKNASDQLEIRLSICEKKHFNNNGFKNNNF